MTSTAATLSARSALRAIGPAIGAAARHRRRDRSKLLVVSLLYLAAVAVVTLGPQPLDSGMSTALAVVIDFLAASTPLALGYADLEFLANVAMFVPFGALVALWIDGRRLIACASGFALSAGVEIVQLVIPGRVSDPRDLVANTIGSLLGIALLAAHRLVRRRTCSPRLQPAPQSVLGAAAS